MKMFSMYSIFQGSGNKASLLGHLCHLISVSIQQMARCFQFTVIIFHISEWMFQPPTTQYLNEIPL